ncbi:hypothetical protein BDW59DRAFT_157116 [Aspergillus cavernicola]|uniref:Uncharacterized protein n=1 Tax=Aspergillus cavernicola TaxID=176166 RepID=A0ABR4IYW3_9EURO
MESILGHLEDKVNSILRHEDRHVQREVENAFAHAKTESEEHARQEQKEKAPVLAVTSLGPGEVEKLFHLQISQSTNHWDLTPNERRLTPQHLRNALADYGFALSGGSENEAKMRRHIEAVMFTTLAALGESDSGNARDSIALSRLIHFELGRDMKLPWIKAGRKCIVSGRTDYSLWHGDAGHIEANMLVVEAKKRGESGTSQALSYMAMLHHARRKAGRNDTSVYGIATDSYHWAFLYLDIHSEYTVFRYDWDHGYAVEIILTLVKVMRHASRLAASSESRRGSLEEMAGVEY